MSNYSVCAILCAAGKGQRAGFSENKVLLPYGEKTVLEHALSAFDFPMIDEILVTSSKEDFEKIENICSAFANARVVLGGEDRSHSVYNALQETSCDLVLIHDAARPFVRRESIEGCIHSIKTHGSGICAIPATDTVALVKNGQILSVPNRKEMYQIQTPQGFFTENIRAAYTQAFSLNDKTYTDDSSVFARFCGVPHICEGSRENKKLTYAEDFSSDNARCGFGIDTHAFGKAQEYILLAGVKIPSESGLVAHSDGDVLIHAVMDAILSAAGLKDIGHYFPDTDEKWKDADSMKMLSAVVALVGEKGFAVQNLSVAIQAEKPRLARYIDDMKNNLSSLLKIDPSRIGISAGTNEGLGYVGEGKGITVNAYVLLR